MVDHAVVLAIGSQHHTSHIVGSRAHAMLPALGKPLVVRIMTRLYRAGIKRYTVIVGENEGEVAAYLNTQWMPDVEIELVFRLAPESTLRVLQGVAKKHRRPFLLSNYNCFTHSRFPESMVRLHRENPDHLILASARKTLSTSTSNRYAVLNGDHVTDMTTQSGDHILTDVYIYGHEAVHQLIDLPGADIDPLIDIAHRTLQSGAAGMLARAAWSLQIEGDRDLVTLNKHLLDEGTDANILTEIPQTVQIIPPVRIDPQVTVGHNAIIGPHVYLERGCTLGHDVTVRNCIVLTHATVPSGQTVENTIIALRGPVY